MYKVFEFKDYKFCIKVELNAVDEKRTDGKKYHRVTINDMGLSNWFRTKNVLTEHLRMGISDLEILAMDFVNKRVYATVEERILSDLGFLK